MEKETPETAQEKPNETPRRKPVVIRAGGTQTIPADEVEQNGADQP